MRETIDQLHAWFHPECPACRRFHFGCGYLKWEKDIIRRIHPVEWLIPPNLEKEKQNYSQLIQQQQELLPLVQQHTQKDKIEVTKELLKRINTDMTSYKLNIDGMEKAAAGDFDGALELMKKSEEVSPGNLGLQCDIIRICMHIGNFTLAKQTCEYLEYLLQHPRSSNIPPGIPQLPYVGVRNEQATLIQMHASLSDFYLELGVFHKSLQHGNKVLEIDPGQQKLWRNIGIAQLQLGNFPAAIEAFQFVIPEFPGAADPWVALGLAKQGHRDVHGAVQAFQQATHLVPNAFFAWFCLAEAYTLLADISKAVDACQRALNILPIEPLVQERLALLQERLAHADLEDGKMDSKSPIPIRIPIRDIRELNKANEEKIPAADDFRELSSGDFDQCYEPGVDPVVLTRDAIAKANGDAYEAAEKDFLHVVQVTGGSKMACFNLGVYYLGAERFAEAEKVVREIIKQYPKWGLGWNLLGHIFHYQGLLGDACYAYQQVSKYGKLDLDGNRQRICYEHDKSIRDVHMTQIALTLDLRFKSAAPESRQRLEKIIKIQSQMNKCLRGGAYGLLALKLVTELKFAAAIHLLRSVLKSYPDNAELWAILGGIYIFAKDKSEGEAALKKALEINSKDGFVWREFSKFYRSTGRMDEANRMAIESENCYKAYLAREPEDFTMWEELAEFYREQAQEEKAKEVYQKAQDLRRALKTPM